MQMLQSDWLSYLKTVSLSALNLGEASRVVSDYLKAKQFNQQKLIKLPSKLKFNNVILTLPTHCQADGWKIKKINDYLGGKFYRFHMLNKRCIYCAC